MGGATGGGILRLTQPWKRAILKVSEQNLEFAELLADHQEEAPLPSEQVPFIIVTPPHANSFLAIAMFLATYRGEQAIPRNRIQNHGVINDLISPFLSESKSSALPADGLAAIESNFSLAPHFSEVFRS